jgi:hypothetical protein
MNAALFLLLMRGGAATVAVVANPDLHYQRHAAKLHYTRPSTKTHFNRTAAKLHYKAKDANQ